MAHVRELRIYPVKGLDPALPRTARVLPSGALEFDRRWALVDARGHFVNGKNRPAIHTIRAAFDLDRGEMSVDGGPAWSLTRDGETIARWFSERFGEPLEWREDAAAGFPDDTDSPGPTIASEASFEAVAAWFGLTGDAVRRRFRTNIEIAGVDSWWEDRLYGGEVSIGADAKFAAVNPCARCIVPSRDALSGAVTPEFQKLFMELRRQHLPPDINTALFSHYYRFSVNTRAVNGGGVIQTGDRIAL